MLTDKGNILVAVHNKFALLDPKTKKLTDVVDVEGKTKPNNRFNDGKCDPAGRLWAGKSVTSMNNSPTIRSLIH